MPRRRRIYKARVGGVTPAQKRYFTNPFTRLQALRGDPSPFASADDARAVWLQHGARWTAEYAAAHPGASPSPVLEELCEAVRRMGVLGISVRQVNRPRGFADGG